ncbi:MAG TPA: SMC family ATPase [Acidimicrobiia bacterium]
MRPINLALSGFAAFRERTEIDFEGVDFFALVGPTGSGKSSVIDGMCFALYGSVPRYDDRRVVAPIITMGAQEAKVSLTFEVDGERYVATRVVRRTKSGATTPEARLERVGDGSVLAGSAREMEAAVVELLGLPFEHFIKCVVLPQGEFARFLHDKPADRQQLLVELLNLGFYARMGQKARALAAEHENEAERDRRRLTELGDDATDARKREIEGRVAAIARVRAELKATTPVVEQLTKDAEHAEQELRRAGALGELLRKVEVPAAVTELARHRADADAALTKAASAAGEAEAATRTRAEAIATHPELAELNRAHDAHADLAGVAAGLAKASAALDAAERTERTAIEELEQAETARDEAVAARDALRTEHRAHLVAQTLHAGEPCPVCLQIVAAPPKLREPAAIDLVDREVERTKQQHAALAKRRETATTGVATARQALAELQRREAELTERVAGFPDATALEALIVEVRAGHAALEAARSTETAARRALDRARTARDSLTDEIKQVGARFREQRDPLLQHGAEPPPLRDELLDDWNALAAWSLEESGACEERARLAKERHAGAVTERRGLLVGLAGACQDLDVELAGEITLGALLEATVRAETEAANELTRVKAGIAEAKKLRKAIGKREEEAEVAKTLAGLLAANRFERWLVAEALDVLVTDASRALQELSGGHYSFAFDEGSFLVVDHRNADERRSVRTLSGGETFQAALALALALSDQLGDLAANGAARLESIFLDEGFGTLDPDTLDAVASTIENLAVGDRMVGLVTHVAELSERVPVRYVVGRGARTATVEKVLT